MATDAHNAYLNLALGVGVPGLLLVVVWVVVLPLLDFFKQAGDQQNRFVALFFLRIWLFGLYSSSFEGALFMQVGEVFVIFMIAVFGLRYLSIARLAP